MQFSHFLSAPLSSLFSSIYPHLFLNSVLSDVSDEKGLRRNETDFVGDGRQTTKCSRMKASSSDSFFYKVRKRNVFTLEPFFSIDE